VMAGLILVNRDVADYSGDGGDNSDAGAAIQPRESFCHSPGGGFQSSSFTPAMSRPR
jgi:hypothetical protein